MEVSSAWIDRSGNYYGVDEAEHNKWAWDYLTKQYGIQEARAKVSVNGEEAYIFLEIIGWVRVMKWPGLEVQFILPKSLSHAQKQTIDRYCSIYKVKLPFKDDLF